MKGIKNKTSFNIYLLKYLFPYPSYISIILRLGFLLFLCGTERIYAFECITKSAFFLLSDKLYVYRERIRKFIERTHYYNEDKVLWITL